MVECDGWTTRPPRACRGHDRRHPRQKVVVREGLDGQRNGFVGERLRERPQKKIAALPFRCATQIQEAKSIVGIALDANPRMNIVPIDTPWTQMNRDPDAVLPAHALNESGRNKEQIELVVQSAASARSAGTNRA